MKKINTILFIALIATSILAFFRIYEPMQEITEQHNYAFEKCQEQLWNNPGEFTNEEIAEMYNNYLNEYKIWE